jgi:hypothetical protein
MVIKTEKKKKKKERQPMENAYLLAVILGIIVCK